jgi:hypothetical protein
VPTIKEIIITTSIENVPYIDRRELAYDLGLSVPSQRIVGDGSAATVTLPDDHIPSVIHVIGETANSDLIAPADKTVTGVYQSNGNSSAALTVTAGVGVVVVTVAATDVANTDIGAVTCSLD